MWTRTGGSTRKRLTAWSVVLISLAIAGACSSTGRSTGGVAGESTAQVTPEYASLVGTFTTSLHRTGQGKQTFYNEDPNGGFEKCMHVPYEELACKGCHTPGIGGAAKGTLGCLSCHDTDEPTAGAEVDATLTGVCGTCHSRQKAEAALYTDVHRSAGMECMDCHSLEDVHGDGNVYASMLEPGAIDAKCSDCHEGMAANDYHDIHSNTVACTTCHIQSVVTCNNCHIETELVTGAKLAYAQFKDWQFLLNRDGKVHSGNYQSVIFQDKSVVAFAPFYAHTISRNAVDDCTDCHGNESVTDWFQNDDHIIDVVIWDPSLNDPDGRNLTYRTGIIPVPPNFLQGGMRFDFATLTEVGSGHWKFVKTGADIYQILYGSPLTVEQMNKMK